MDSEIYEISRLRVRLFFTCQLEYRRHEKLVAHKSSTVGVVFAPVVAGVGLGNLTINLTCGLFVLGGLK